MINNSAVLATTYAEEAGLDARFRSTKQNSTDRATQAEESAHQAAQTGYQHRYRPSDSRTFTPAVHRPLRSAHDAKATANHLRLHS